MRWSQVLLTCRSNQSLGLPICEVGAVWPTLQAAVRRQRERLSPGPNRRQAWVFLHCYPGHPHGCSSGGEAAPQMSL